MERFLYRKNNTKVCMHQWTSNTKKTTNNGQSESEVVVMYSGVLEFKLGGAHSTCETRSESSMIISAHAHHHVLTPNDAYLGTCHYFLWASLFSVFIS